MLKKHYEHSFFLYNLYQIVNIKINYSTLRPFLAKGEFCKPQNQTQICKAIQSKKLASL